jgi:hypothetical protein
MEIRPDHEGRQLARAHLWEEEWERGSEPGWASHDPPPLHSQRPRRPPRPPTPLGLGEEDQGDRPVVMRKTVVGQRRVRET